jgi:hypothetical protein
MDVVLQAAWGPWRLPVVDTTMAYIDANILDPVGRHEGVSIIFFQITVTFNFQIYLAFA